MPRQAWFASAAAIAAVALFVVAGSACGPSFQEGETRPFTREGRAGMVTLSGTELFTEGEWVKHGEFTFYDDAGDEMARGAYVRGLENGPWTQVYEDGCRGVGAFEKGMRAGPWETFHRNGKLQDKGQYEQDVRIGTWVSFRADGTLLREAEYSAGELNGRVTWFLKDGTSVDESRSGTYRDGERIKGR